MSSTKYIVATSALLNYAVLNLKIYKYQNQFNNKIKNYTTASNFIFFPTSTKNHLSLPIFLEPLLQLFRARIRPMPLDRLPILINDKLGEIPLDKISQGASLLVLQVLPQRMGVAPVNIHLLEHVKLQILLVVEGADLGVVSRFLVGELVAREGQDAKPLALRVFVVQFL